MLKFIKYKREIVSLFIIFILILINQIYLKCDTKLLLTIFFFLNDIYEKMLLVCYLTIKLRFK
jgi:hypothetical protein